MTKSETVKLYLLFILCLFFMGIGADLTRYGKLGSSHGRCGKIFPLFFCKTP